MVAVCIIIGQFLCAAGPAVAAPASKLAHALHKSLLWVKIARTYLVGMILFWVLMLVYLFGRDDDR